jgi:benzodiazapine receptor
VNKSTANEVLKLVVSIVICQMAGFIGSLFTRSSVSTWYTTLNKASFNPPDSVFGPVWTTLYLLMGISLYLVWRRVSHWREVKTALVLFAIQLILNTLWSLLFFGLRFPLAGLVDILLLWAAILFTLFLFYRHSRAAGILLMPYILWVSFAVVLNASIWLLNR